MPVHRNLSLASPRVYNAIRLRGADLRLGGATATIGMEFSVDNSIARKQSIQAHDFASVGRQGRRRRAEFRRFLQLHVNSKWCKQNWWLSSLKDKWQNILSCVKLQHSFSCLLNNSVIVTTKQQTHKSINSSFLLNYPVRSAVLLLVFVGWQRLTSAGGWFLHFSCIVNIKFMIVAM